MLSSAPADDAMAMVGSETDPNFGVAMSISVPILVQHVSGSRQYNVQCLRLALLLPSSAHDDDPNPYHEYS